LAAFSFQNGASLHQHEVRTTGEHVMEKSVQDYILSKLEYAYAHSSGGLTVEELLDQDAHLSGYTPEKLLGLLNVLENHKLVTAEVIVGRGEVYRLLVFETFDDLCRAKSSGSICL
jgi:hypothetical protein